MNTITQILFLISDSLLVPVIILLLLLFLRSLILLGGFYNSLIMRRRRLRILAGLEEKSQDEILSLASELEPLSHTLLGKYAQLLIGSAGKLTEEEEDFHLNQFEIECDRELSTAKLLTKAGPILGLMGTLISMSPALVGLSAGDIDGMAYNMQIVFATTVVGLVISLVGILILQYKQRWYAEELNSLELISSRLRSFQAKSEKGVEK